MLRWHSVWYGHWHHRASHYSASLQSVSSSYDLVFRFFTHYSSKYGFDTSSDPSGKLAAANLGANIVSVMQAGAFAGALIAFPISDAIGRKKSLLIAACFAGVGGIMQAAASGAIACLYVGR